MTTALADALHEVVMMMAHAEDVMRVCHMLASVGASSLRRHLTCNGMFHAGGAKRGRSTLQHLQRR